MGVIQFPFIYFCLLAVGLNVYRASNVWVAVCNSSSLVLQSQSAEVSRTVTISFEWNWTLMKGHKIPRIELNTVHFYQYYSLLCAMNSSTLDVRIIASMCSLLNSPFQAEVQASSVLEQHPRYLPHRDRASYNTYITHRHRYTRQDSSGRVTSPSQRPLPTQHKTTHKTNKHALNGVRNRDPRKENAAELHLKPCGQKVRRSHTIICHCICADTLM